MLIKSVAVVIAAVSALPAFAQTTTRDAYVSAVIGGVSVAGLVLIVGIYKLGRLAMSKLKTIGTSVGQQAAATTVELKHPLSRRVELTPVKVVEPPEDCWSTALSEFESPSRRPGLWAKAFAQAAGNEAGAKAEYLRQRAEELHAESEARDIEARAAALEAERRRIAELSPEEAYAALPKGKCPNCGAIIALDSQVCPKCDATFWGDQGWRVLRIETT